ncbi:MAG: tRNA (adenosine(37)-N6)-threonylcarbamoyltransferase complex dimerization subunit type 1 TsaB [Bacillota bacterium]|nr:tRNA (adenosine(37)-N6)-threonylcarbamoyltransferase complex dimerization subunit type 1 TsaB [Bacillota bacterium]
MKILACETSGAPASAAVIEDGKILAASYQNMGFTHSRTLLPMIDVMLKNAGLKIQDMDVFACAAGPGSFTGLRIGVSTVKGLAFAQDKPCAAVSTLEGMAWNLLFSDDIICAVMDARANNVYNALFRAEKGSAARLCPDRALSIDELGRELSQTHKKYILVGDGAALCYNILSEKGLDLTLAPENLRFQNAYGIARAADVMALSGALKSPGEISVSYLRLCQAERERMKKLGELKK